MGFHDPDIWFSPLANWVAMPDGADTYYTGNELLGRHTDHGDIGLRQRFVDAMYLDMRRKKLVSAKRYGGKVQVHEFDTLVNRFGSGPQFWLAVLRERMMADIKQTHEKVVRDGIFNWAQFKFLADGSKWAASTADFSTITRTDAYKVNIKLIEDVRLRMSERSMQYAGRFGTYANPIPGFPGDVMVMTTPGVIYDIWNTDEGQWMEDLRTLQDERIINGGQFRYRGATYLENPNIVLYNAGTLDKQIAVTQPINWGDGAPDPDSSNVDNVYLVGQGSSDVTHYVQGSSFGASDYTVGDRVTIHVARTTDWGIADGCDVFDGKSYEAVVYEVNASANRLTFTEPITIEYTSSFTATPNGGSEATCYAFITKAQHIHPILVVGTRGMVTFAARTKIRIHNPTDDQVDLPGIFRQTWDEYGELNRWNPYVYEIIFAAASGTRSGRDEVAIY